MQARAFTLKHGAGPETAPPARAHNVGGCGGSCGGSCGGGACRCGPGGFGGGGGGGFRPGGNGNFTTPTPVPPTGDPTVVPMMAGMAGAAGIDPSQRVADTTFAQVMSIIGQLPSLIPRAFDRAAWANYVTGRAAWLTEQRCIPYEDAVRDCLMMVDVPSPLVVVGAGLTVPVSSVPTSGWLDAY